MTNEVIMTKTTYVLESIVGTLAGIMIKFADFVAESLADLRVLLWKLENHGDRVLIFLGA